MLTVKEPAQAREWLGDLARQVTTAERKSDDARVNVAFTATGLRRLGLSDTQLAVFPYAFRDGMASTRRARVLGDVGDNAPATWHWGGQNTPWTFSCCCSQEMWPPLIACSPRTWSRRARKDWRRWCHR